MTDVKDEGQEEKPFVFEKCDTFLAKNICVRWVGWQSRTSEVVMPDLLKFGTLCWFGSAYLHTHGIFQATLNWSLEIRGMWQKHIDANKFSTETRQWLWL